MEVVVLVREAEVVAVVAGVRVVEMVVVVCRDGHVVILEVSIKIRK